MNFYVLQNHCPHLQSSAVLVQVRIILAKFLKDQQTYFTMLIFFRLLKSLEEADYNFEKNNPNWNIILEIRIDVGGGKKVAFENSKIN